MPESGSARGVTRQDRRHLLIALALASVLPCAALVWPGTIPREIVVLALIAWLGIFVIALGSTWAEGRRRRKMLDEPVVTRRSVPRG